MRILVIGHKGMLGQDLMHVLKQKYFQLEGADLEDVDITRPGSVDDLISRLNPQVVINCAAYTQVDQAEKERFKAMEINAHGPAILAKVCALRDVRLVHISTDFVFDGSKKIPYQPNDTAMPLGAYGRTKLEGERALAGSGAKWLIIRTSWLYGVHGKNFVKTMLKLAQQGKDLKVVDDQIGSPTWTMDLCQALARLIEAEARGIYHYCNRGHCSWFDLARATFQHSIQLGMLEKMPNLEPISTSQYPTLAVRPFYSVLNCDKFADLTGQPPPFWDESLQHMLKQLVETEVSL